MVLFEKKKRWKKSTGVTQWGISYENGTLVVWSSHQPSCGCCDRDTEVEIPIIKEELIELLQKLQ